MVKPLCFMVMPYGRKATNAEAGRGPAEINFNALWDNAYVPVIAELGYEPVRADQDNGALIITQMLERLYFADLVLADMTIPNGNVYYEVGIRHAAKPTGCVLLCADWSQALFDVAQMRTVRYPLPEGEVTAASAQAIRQAIRAAIPKLAQGASPMFETIRGYPGSVDEQATSMKAQMTRLAQFQAEVRAVRAVGRGECMAHARQLVEKYGNGPMTAQVATALLLMLRDCADTADDWSTVLAFIDGLPDELKALGVVVEQRALAISHTGRHLDAIAALEAIVAVSGPTPERLGLLGGRYKRLHKLAGTPAEKDRMLARSIEHYERGMELDLNEYYCSSNLPGLYRSRNRKGDEERAQTVLRLVIAACERARRRGATDPWLRPTLLVAAFDSGSAAKAEELADEVAAEGPAMWQLDSTLTGLKTSLQHVKNEKTAARLAAVVARLEALDTR